LNRNVRERIGERKVENELSHTNAQWMTCRTYRYINTQSAVLPFLIFDFNSLRSSSSGNQTFLPLPSLSPVSFAACLSASRVFNLLFLSQLALTDAMNLLHGAKVWLEDRDSAWLPAEVLDSDGNKILLLTDSGKKVSDFTRCCEFEFCSDFGNLRRFFVQVFASKEKLLPRDADEEEHGGFEDMTRLAYLNEPGVLFNLRRRYALNDIYVSV